VSTPVVVIPIFPHPGFSFPKLDVSLPASYDNLLYTSILKIGISFVITSAAISKTKATNKRYLPYNNLTAINS
jgi:hypothetical protein